MGISLLNLSLSRLAVTEGRVYFNPNLTWMSTWLLYSCSADYLLPSCFCRDSSLGIIWLHQNRAFSKTVLTTPGGISIVDFEIGQVAPSNV